MQSICAAAAAAILTLASPAPCSAWDGPTPQPVTSAQPQQMASTVGYGLPRLPSVPKVPKVPQPKWP